MRRQPEAVTVIGAGVVGCYIAYRLAKEGVAVTVVERDTPGAGASGTAAGNIEITSDTYGRIEATLCAEGLRLHRRYLPEIKEASGIDPMDQEVRFFFAALSDDEADEGRVHIENARWAGVDMHWIDGADARELEPRLSPEIVGGGLAPTCLQIDAQGFVSALADAAKTLGVKIRVGEAVGLKREGARVTGVRLLDGTETSCDAVVLAMGAWAGVVAADWLGAPLPIRPYPLQKLHLRTDQEPLRCAVHWGGVNIVSRLGGLIHAGSKHDPVGFRPRPTQDGRRWILERVSAVLPGLEAEVADAQAACAASTPGGIPIVGPVETLEGVYVAATADDGFHLSAVLAEIMTDLLVRDKQHPLLADILPSRVLGTAPTDAQA